MSSRSTAAAERGRGTPDRRSQEVRGRNGSPTSAVAAALGLPAGSATDWESLARQAVRDANPLTRRLAATRLLESLTAENAAAIREQLVSFGAEGELWNDFNYAWGALAGRTAFDFAAESEERDLHAVLSGWASARPGEAIALLDNLPEEMRGQRADYARSVVAGLAANDPQLATDLVLRLGAEGVPRSTELIDLVAREALRTGGPQGAAQWSQDLPDGPLKGAAMGRVAGAYASRDLEAAAQWAEASAERDFAARAVEAVADTWARQDPGAAVAWLENLPAAEGQSAGLRSVFGDWEDRDPVAAGEYLMSMRQSPQRDAAVSGFSRGYAWQDPQTAIAWAESISDPSLRVETLTRAGQAYFRRDPNSAREWLAESGLPPEARQAVENSSRRR